MTGDVRREALPTFVPRSYPERPSLAFLVVAVLWVVLLQLVHWPAPFYPVFASESPLDSAAFATAGALLAGGAVPYVTYWDHKPPLVHVIDAMALALSGGKVWGVWLASVLATLTAIGLVYVSLRRVLGTWTAVVGVAFFAFSLPRPLASNLTEQYALPLQWAAFLAFVGWLMSGTAPRRSTFSFGLKLGACAALIGLLRPNLVAVAAALWLACTIVLVRQRRFRSSLRLALGAAAGAAALLTPTVLYLDWRGALPAFWDQVVHYNALYAAAPWTLRLRTMQDGLRYLDQAAPLALPLAGWFLAVFRLWRDRLAPDMSALLMVGVLWLPLELVLASVSGRFYGHYFTPVLSPLVLLTALLVAEPLRADLSVRGPLRPGRLAAALVAALAVLPITETALQYRDKGVTRARMEQVTVTAEYVKRHVPAHDPILVWGHAADVYFFSGRPPASRFIYSLPLLTPGYSDGALVAGFLHELERSKPAIIIDATPNADATLGEDLVPGLDRWDPEWRYPDPRSDRWSYWRGPSWWAMPAELKAFYDYVATRYVPDGSVGPLRWVVYRRVPGGSESRDLSLRGDGGR